MPKFRSVSLFEVLEDEYINLHSRKLESVQVDLVDPFRRGKRTVDAKPDWAFDKTHFKAVDEFARELLRYAVPAKEGSAEATSQPSRSLDTPVDIRTSVSISVGLGEDGVHTRDWAKQNLVEYLVNAKENPLPIVTLLALATGAKIADGELQTLTTSLNTRLGDRDLYANDRFSFNWLNSASRTLVGEYHSSRRRFEGADLRRFNRLLLEDAFPQFIERLNNIRLAAIYKRLHNVQQSALCLSGGGIRSGTFALGILQGLARHNLLKEFHYLSTVSGGGYIGSWLAAWIHRHSDGLDGVTRD